jgi:hypothetical protein
MQAAESDGSFRKSYNLVNFQAFYTGKRSMITFFTYFSPVWAEAILMY